MTKHIQFHPPVLAVTLALSSILLLSAQDAQPKHGIPKDWSMHHLVFSRPGAWVPPARLQKVLHDPRYILQQQIRAAAAAAPSLPAPLSALSDDGPADIAPPPADGPLPRGIAKALVPATSQEVPGLQRPRRIHKDWSVGVGSNGTSGLGEFPATFTQTASPCGTDYALYNTGLGGSSSQATIAAFNNIYATCNGGVPTVYFAYNTGTAAVVNSVVLSVYGAQLAFMQGNSGSAASLIVLKWSNSGGSVSAPTTPASVSASLYRTCTAPCQTSITLNGSPSDTYSSPFYDYSSDSLYVGDDGGKLHKFTGVFNGTPAELTTGGWPAQVSSATTGGALGSPTYDAVSTNVFVGDYLLNYASTCEPSATNSNGVCGYLYRVSSSGAVTQSSQLDYQYGIVDGPIVDPSTEEVYAFVGADSSTACSGGPCAGVFRFPATFASGASGAEAQVGAGYEFMLSGTFDNLYFTSGTGNLYVVGGTGPQNNTLYQIAVTPSGFGAITTGPAVAANYTNGFYAAGLQVTEFYTGTLDYIFLGVLVATNNPSVGQVAGYDVTSGAISPSTTPTGTIATQGGSSGIVVDNSLSTAQNIYFSSLLNATCTTSGAGGCAVQVIQSAP